MPQPPTASWPRRDAAHLLVSSGQMAELEQQLFASGLPLEALMEKAALAVSQELLKPSATGDPGPQPLLQQRLQRHGALVLVGPGHNGGDGLVVARELHLAGLPVRIWSPFERHKPLTESHLRHARWLGIPCLDDPPEAHDPALWIDGLFGIGQRHDPGAALSQLLAERQQQQPGQLVAIDGPTGLCADSGSLLAGAAACAATTYAIGLLKQGWLQASALRWVGQLLRLDLGLPSQLLATLPGEQPLGLDASDLKTAPWPHPAADASKYERGRLLVVAGSRRYLGAAHLALAGASASGCGSLRATVPEELAQQLWQQRPEVVINTAGLERLDAVLFGPGIGATGEAGSSERPSWQQLQAFSGLLLLDADGLNQLARAGPAALAWLQGRCGPTWITPHCAEFGRLFPDLADLPPLEAAPSAAQRSGATVLLKGPRSVIACPAGRRWQLLQAFPQAARAGLGDVLAGYAAGLGAMAMAACQRADGALLAAAALAHAQAGRGGGAPLAIASRLG
ncbi:MAG: NAD(P)H-hydrate epimerase [Prochlorococcaceae cyanobacterium]